MYTGQQMKSTYVFCNVVLDLAKSIGDEVCKETAWILEQLYPCFPKRNYFNPAEISLSSFSENLRFTMRDCGVSNFDRYKLFEIAGNILTHFKRYDINSFEKFYNIYRQIDCESEVQFAVEWQKNKKFPQIKVYIQGSEDLQVLNTKNKFFPVNQKAGFIAILGMDFNPDGTISKKIYCHTDAKPDFENDAKVREYFNLLNKCPSKFYYKMYRLNGQKKYYKFYHQDRVNTDKVSDSINEIMQLYTHLGDTEKINILDKLSDMSRQKGVLFDCVSCGVGEKNNKCAVDSYLSFNDTRE